MTSEDDFDYMSDDFLAHCVKEDIRPGLIRSRTQQRNHNNLKKKEITNETNKIQFKPQKVVEAERREEGLKGAIGVENRGYALLQKMGYKPGSGIGKSGTGRVEPVSIELKSDRQGLGRQSALKEIAEQKRSIRARYQKRREELTEDFRARMARRAHERQTETDLRKSQRICEQLDKNKDVEEPAEWWFWPPRLVNQSEDESYTEEEREDEEEEEEGDDTGEEEVVSKESILEDEAEEDTEEEDVDYEPPEMLEILTLYLRVTYCYCIWCGAQYDDDKDLRENCPGPRNEDH